MQFQFQPIAICLFAQWVMLISSIDSRHMRGSKSNLNSWSLIKLFVPSLLRQAPLKPYRWLLCFQFRVFHELICKHFIYQMVGQQMTSSTFGRRRTQYRLASTKLSTCSFYPYIYIKWTIYWWTGGLFLKTPPDKKSFGHL